MKKLYRSKGTVHPSPPPPPPPPSEQHISDHYLSFLPAAILTLTVALSPQDKQVLAYLISCSSSSSSPSYSSCHFPGSSRNTKNTRKSSSSASAPAATNNKSGDHSPLFNCNCFRCYMSYWVRWDSSPNRQLIHEIIDAFEDSLVIRKETTNKSCKKDRRAKKVGSSTTTTYSTVTESTRPSEPEPGESDPVGDVSNSSGGEVGDEVEGEEGYGDEKGSVRKIVSFLGERIWGVWT